MKRSLLIIISYWLLLNSSSFGQAGTWTWISGSNTEGSSGVFGVQGVPSVNNHPPGLYEPAEWKDKQGNFWIYGGWTPNYSDLWKFNPVTLEWTWVKGNGGTSELPVYGTKGIPDPANTPGERTNASVTWVDTSGFLWLFGGAQGSFNQVSQNDLWKYDITSNQWTWVDGSNSIDGIGAHGTQGVPSPSNTPGARDETCSAWTDSLNNLWLFGGNGYDDNGNSNYLNDLWKYNINTNEWTWMKGSAFISAPSDYGTKGTANASNDPGARISYTKWKDLQDNFWLIGGSDMNDNRYNDVWKYNLSINEWSWMSGTNTPDDAGIYNANCVFNTTNQPYSRYEQRSAATDNCGRFWLFGGAGSPGYFNDLWVYDPQQLKWNWATGTNVPDQPGSYGSLGIASPSNVPPSRWGAVAWWGNNNKFYLFGGSQNDITYCYSDVWVFNPDTNCVAVCGAVVVVPPVANFQANQVSICANDCVNFTDLSTDATAWQWHFAGALDSTSAAQNPQYVCYSNAGIYNVTLIAFNSGGSDTVTFSNYIHVAPAPPTPLVTDYPGIGNDTLVCSTDPSYTSYQWSYDSTAIAGATDTFLVVSKSGDYNMQVSNANGCKIAVGINIIIGIQNYANDHVISLSPNPVQDKFTVYGLQFTVARIEIYNVLGQICEQSEIRNTKSEIDVSSLPSGIYFVQVANESGRWVGRFVKE